jgi:hypothetical protein
LGKIQFSPPPTLLIDTETLLVNRLHTFTRTLLSESS